MAKRVKVVLTESITTLGIEGDVVDGHNEVIIYNEHKFAMISSLQKKSISLRSMISKFSKDTELILVEGLKHSSLRKLEVYRADLNKPILCNDDKRITCLVYDKKFEGFEKIKNF